MMFLIGNVSRVGLDVALARALPLVREERQRHAMIGAGLLIVSIVALVAAAIFLIQPVLAREVTASLNRMPWRALLFVATCGAWGVGLVLDQVLLVSKRGQIMVCKNATISSVRLALLPVMLAAVGGSFGIFAATTLGVVAGLGLVGYLLGNRVPTRWNVIRGGLHEIRSSLAGYALGSYFSALVAGLPTWLLPLIVIREAGASAAAYFYASWMIATVMNTVPSALATGFFMEGARRGGASRQLVRNVYSYTLLCSCAATLLLLLAAQWILVIFKPDYAAQATPLLRLLALANIPSALVQVYCMKLQLERKLLTLGIQNSLLTGIALVGSYLLLPSLGLSGVGIAYGAGCLCAAIYLIIYAWRRTALRSLIRSEATT
jgi:O-antigen/teichoic acid export membrane protein